MKSLLVVESPAKAKTIGKYLGSNYEVVASFGHVRDLPSKPGSVDPKNDFFMNYEVSSKSTKYVSDIVSKMKGCDKLILAPDPDREGESIAWHVLEVLKQKKVIKDSTKVERVVFNAITKSSITEAIKHPRAIDMNLVNAQQARRALDYLVGFTLSPVLWKKLPGSRSAGRVQSVALRIICDREEEILAFKSEEYWDIKVDLKNEAGQNVLATLTHIDGKKLEKFSLTNNIDAHKVGDLLKNKSYNVVDIARREVKRKPYAPFITSSLQQEAARKLGFSTKKTMQIAQKLYEGQDIGGEIQGLITYMRTDGVYMAPEAITSARNFIKSEYGEKYLPDQPIFYKSKVKNSQEAHEAIRPTDPTLSPKKISKYLEKDFAALYDLIWKRTIASQMEDQIMDQVSVTIETKPPYGQLKATGSVIKFDGFNVLYNESNDEESEEDEDKKVLPNLQKNDPLDLIEVRPVQHFTEPPPRYSEASLVKRMEELGIGRPSTYSAIISVLQDRGYVKLEKRRFIPEERGKLVVVFLKEFFSKYVEYNYTAGLEDELDIISNGELGWKIFLKNFWVDFDKNINQVAEKSITEILQSINERVAVNIFGLDEKNNIKNKCPSCADGILGLKIGKYGVFIGCSNYPTCKHTMQVAHDKSDDGENASEKGYDEPKSLGKIPGEGEVFIKKGPYGFYIELLKEETDKKPEKPKVEEKAEGKKKAKGKKSAKSSAPKPKRVSIPKNIKIDEVDLKLAKKLLSLPREVGLHPETGLKIVASIGPFGPYLLHDGKYSSVKEDDILEIGLNRAVVVISENEARKLAKNADANSNGGKKKTKPVRKTTSTKKTTKKKASSK